MPMFSTDLSTRSCDGYAVVALRGELDLAISDLQRILRLSWRVWSSSIPAAWRRWRAAGGRLGRPGVTYYSPHRSGE